MRVRVRVRAVAMARVTRTPGAVVAAAGAAVGRGGLTAADGTGRPTGRLTSFNC